MSTATRRTRACTIETLDERLKAAMRAHGQTLGLEDIEADVLMCCETITVHQKKGFSGGIRTTLSAVYVTPKWLVWAESTERDDAAAGAAQLRQIQVQEHGTAARYAIAADQGIHITGRYTDEDQTGSTLIVLDAKAEGQRFRRVLDKALRQ